MLQASARPFLSAHGADDGAGLGYVLLLLLHGGQLTVPARAPAAFIPKRACEHACEQRGEHTYVASVSSARRQSSSNAAASRGVPRMALSSNTVFVSILTAELYM